MSQPSRRGSLSGLELRVLAAEISTALTGAYVSNIYSLGESQVFRMRSPGGEASLVLSPRLGAWMTERPAREETGGFTTSLRSHLLRAKLESVEQLDLDRVLTLWFAGKEDGRLRLVLEMMPPGNLLLVGGDGRVVIALREVRSAARRVARGREYTPPAQGRASIDSVSREGLAALLGREATLGRALGRGLSIPKRYVDEILDRSSLRQEDPSAAPEILDRLMVAIGEVVDGMHAPSPSLVRTAEGTLELMVVHPRRMEVVKSSPSMSGLLDGLLPPETLGGEEDKGGPADEHERRVQEYNSTIASLEKKKEGLLQTAGELRVLAGRVRDAPDPERALKAARSSEVAGKDILGSLDALAGKGTASMSSAVFDAAKGREREVGEIDEAVEGLRGKLRKESERVTKARPGPTSLARPRREWYEKFRWFFTTGGKLAVGGRDAQSNTTLIRRHLEDGDTVYHADLFGSPFFVLKGGSGQDEQDEREVAKATVVFSSAWKTGLGAADAYWVNPDQVAAAGPTGEYLAHGSFAIRGKKNFVTKIPVEVAVGVDEGGRVVSGPEESVMKVARGHVTLVPGREKPSETAKKVLHELSQYASPGAALLLDDVQRMLPSGGGKIVRKRADRKPEEAPKTY